MRRIQEKTGWESGRVNVLFTGSVLEASEAHERQLQAINSLEVRWAAVDVVRRAAADGIARANARVAWQDLTLDRTVRWFANELLRDAGGDNKNKVFRAYFPEAPNEVIRLGLESEIARCEGFAVVKARVPVSASAAAKLTAVEAAITAGLAALAARRAAYAARAGASLDVASWKEAANAARESVYLQLRAWALENGEERGYADRFFPANSLRAEIDEDDGEDDGGDDGDDGGDKKPIG